jgi:hypothetical protein
VITDTKKDTTEMTIIITIDNEKLQKMISEGFKHPENISLNPPDKLNR